MTSEEQKQLQCLAEHYEKYGVSFVELLCIINRAPKGLSFKQALNGIRLALSVEYGEREWFSMEDVKEMMGCTDEALFDEIGKKEIELYYIDFPLDREYNE